MNILSDLKTQDKIWFEEEKRPYTIQARSDRFLVCTKPLAIHKTVLYTIVDTKELIRGTENLIFGIGAESRKDCEEMISRLEGLNQDIGFQTEISYRNRIPLKIKKYEKNL